MLKAFFSVCIIIDLVSSIAISRYRYFIYNDMNQTAYCIIALI